MTALYLHIGHGKTGSSYLQAAFATSCAQLEANNILYPDLTGSFSSAVRGRITSGNIHADQRDISSYYYDVMGSVKDKPPNIFFSNEMMFPYLSRGKGRRFIADLLNRGVTVKALCFIRDPLEHAVSLYQQLVKRSGYAEPLAKSLCSYTVPSEVERLVSISRDEGWELSVYNYSKHKTGLLEVVEEWLHVDEGTLLRPKHNVVNRSLTAAETVLQREFNRHLGKRASVLISDPLCNQLPDLQSEYPEIGKDELGAFLRRIGEGVEVVNQSIPAGERYSVPDVEEVIGRFRSPDDPELLTFSAAQIEVIARRLSRHLTGK